MTTFFQELKRAREQKRVSLSDIADRTLINIRHLEAIERGNTAILPEAYVRAFIREYAAAIGLDGTETLRRFDEIRRAEDEKARPRERALPRPPQKRPAFTIEPGRFMTPRMATIGASVVIVAVGAILAWNIFSPGATPPVTEIPFQNIVSEQEEQAAAARPAPPPLPRRADSLTLTASVSDTVWMTITVDSLPPREYIFHPGAKPTWRAGTRFLLTLGNAGAVSFALDKQQLGTLGRRGNVVRNVPLTRQTLAAR
ncbi:MAG TPA: RodZ domain-containing protein [Bacteroidota bacterium]|nr:RodZ domain-containing protein [Bacteroidota bacterium]